MQGLLILLMLLGFAYAGCPGVSTEQVLKKVRDNFLGEIKEIRKIEGDFFQVIVFRNERFYPVYTDCSLRYLIVGQMIDMKTGKDLSREALNRTRSLLIRQKEREIISVVGKKKFEAVVKKAPGVVNLLSVINADSIPHEGLITFGNPYASKVVYVVVDPMCPYCARLHSHIERIVSRRSDVQFKVLFYPLPFHRGAEKISSAVVCSRDPAMLSIIFKAMGNRSAVERFSSMSCKEGDRIVKEHAKFSKQAGIKGTPAVIFLNRLKVSGAVPEKTLEMLIDLLHEE